MKLLKGKKGDYKYEKPKGMFLSAPAANIFCTK